jgi:hypothetical protein
MNKRRNRTMLLLISVAVGMTLSVGGGIYIFWKWKEPLRAKTTEARMLALMSVLDAERPQRLSPQSLRALLLKYNRLECLEDAWGTSFVIERSQNDRTPFYTIISLGRDRRRGECCKKWVENWDADAVLSHNGWLQVWYPEAVHARR